MNETPKSDSRSAGRQIVGATMLLVVSLVLWREQVHNISPLSMFGAPIASGLTCWAFTARPLASIAVVIVGFILCMTVAAPAIY